MRLRNRTGIYRLRAEAASFARSIGGTAAQCREAGEAAVSLARSMNTDRIIRKASRAFILDMVEGVK